MAKLFRLFLVMAVAAMTVMGVARAEFDPPGLMTDASAYARSLTAKAPPQPRPGQRDETLKQARAALERKAFAEAIAKFESAIALGAASPTVWLELSGAWAAGSTPNKDRALQSALLAYKAEERQGGHAEHRVTALWRMADILDGPFARPAEALQALREIDAEAQSLPAGLRDQLTPGLEERRLGLRRKVGLNLRSAEVLTDEATPRVCLTFSDRLSTRQGVRFDDFLRIEPPVQAALEARDETLCLRGFEFGAGYSLTLRQGLPGEDGLVLKADETQRLRVPDRPTMISFRGSSFILPRGGPDGIPVITVNADSVDVAVYRVGDRMIAPALGNDGLFGQLNAYGAERLAERNGELVWKGSMATPGKRNREAVTALSFRQVAGESPKPGLYAVTASAPDRDPNDDWMELATQWVLVSDIGLTSFRGADGLTVFARSYATAKPMAGVEVALLARNNAELARAVTDDLGRVRFPDRPAAEGGNAPQAVMAYAGPDFAMLDLTRAAFDLSDRGVGGRAAPGPMDAFVYTDRGVYRQGETVNLSILLRDDRTEAVENFPLTVKVLRPSGTEYFAGTLPAGPAGAHFLPLTLSATAPLGGWEVLAYADPKGEPVGRATFQVDDFVPLKLALEAKAAASHLTPDQPVDVTVDARFLYGPPAAGLTGTAELVLRTDPLPFPQHKGFQFGLEQETFDARVETLEFPETDAEGRSVVSVSLPSLPDVTRPLRADVRVALSEPGGRPARASVALPVRAKDFSVGLRPRFPDGQIGEGHEAQFDVIAVAPDGALVAKPGLSWELIEERVTFVWYEQDGLYSYKAITKDVPLTSGTVNATASGPAALSAGRRDFGRYRLEVTDRATGVASSVRFASGWQTSDEADETPDKLTVSLDKPAYHPGETARVRLTPPFAGEVLLTVATDRLFEVRALSVPADGATVEVPVNAAWGPGAYVTATAFRPPVRGRDRQPVRALGVAWVGIDPAARALDVALEAPATVRPRTPLEVAVKVAAAGGGAADGDAVKDAYVTLAAVDEGILRLTDFASPQPEKHFFGKRMLGLDIRDDYGRLIHPMDGAFGALRQGGDASMGGLPVVPFSVVSLFRGPVKVGPDGVARLRLDLPDFNGELRLMAVAFSRGRVGSAAQPVTVRDPLVADAVMPRFLAPGDDSRVTVSLHNVEAPAGNYEVTVLGADAVGVEGGTQSVALAPGERASLALPLRGLSAGIGRVSLSVTGPDGLALGHDYAITVRPARAPETRFVTRQVAPGETARIDGTELAGYLPGTSAMSVSFSAAPPFDVAGILRALDRYPFGCVEQTISRALPLLAVADVEMALGTARKPGDGLEARVQQAVARTLDRQRFDGSFGLWSAGDETDDWLTAYAVEFLARARQKGHAVPDKPFADALGWLRQRVAAGGDTAEGLAARAYALHALALGGVSMGGQARYLHDTALEKLPTPLAKGQLGAALARMGDRERAASAFDSALAALARNEWAFDYGSTVRDAAALVVLVTEAGMSEGRIEPLVDRLPASSSAVDRTSTQEQAWAVLAAEALMRGSSNSVTLALPGGERKGTRVNLNPTPVQLAGGFPVGNSGKAAIWQAVSLSGVPVVPSPAAREGLRVKRNFFTRAGEPLNLDSLRQNDVFVVLLEGEASTNLHHRAALTLPLPAGWEIESVRLDSAGEAMRWMGDLTFAHTLEARDDRFIAAFDLTETTRSFRLAFLVRAVTPGTYELPGATLEDMYKPRFRAQQATGRITVHAVE
ncbi:alpha-2-macroglobulin [Azospirillum sp. SYSU D00513]|uniref:alpha-2-macroglobulin family protein n=1 Tax=Azospirillum sp. SYSU D00513 TaxID=2812561 RepID=UPI001A95ABC5|nr:alpha-2-macroglobulin [Azospirillum sp. SYSU D00513]